MYQNYIELEEIRMNVIVGIVVFSLISIIYCHDCPDPTQEEFDCFAMRFDPTVPANAEVNFTAFALACENANFTEVAAGEVSSSYS